MPEFLPYNGEMGRLLTSSNHVNFRWQDLDCKVVFSITRQGNAGVCHFTSDKAGLRKLKQALSEWCIFCFWLYDWCEVIVGVVERPSVARLAEKCGFQKQASFGKQQIYIKERSWAA